MIDNLTDAIHYVCSRSGGPGGQNVNKVNSKVTLFFHLESFSLSEEAKKTIQEKSNRMNQEGYIVIPCQISRSQGENKEKALEILEDHLKTLLTKPKKRKRTRISLGAKRRRRENKIHRSEKKASRKKISPN